MAMTDVPLVSLLRTKMQWHQARQKLLAENVANANTPGFKARELAPPTAATLARQAAPSFAVAQTNPLHLAGTSSASEPTQAAAPRFETRPSGTAVTLEDEMMKVAENQADYQLAASLYQKGLAMLRTAAGVRGA